jgi:adenosylmethionine---8-amino-7-oxononanoate aminotransferase
LPKSTGLALLILPIHFLYLFNMAEASNYIWHPFTQMKTATPPLHIQSARGTTLFTADGRQLIDAIASWWVNVHGHCHPTIAGAIARQAQTLEHVIFAGFTHTPALALADKLMQLLPKGFAKIFFSDDGSTSVEVALKMAIQYWHNQSRNEKRTVIALENAYHGDTFGAMSVAERNAFNAAFDPYLFTVKRLPVPVSSNKKEVAAKFTEWVATGEVAAFIFEPLVQGASGMLMYDADGLNELMAIAKAHEVFCIADEVMTGFGRTGKTFAINYLQLQPDIICLSKGITGGFLPLGVTACTQQIFDAFLATDKYKTFFHGHSYTANPIACAAAVASLQMLDTDICTSQIANITASHAGFAAQLQGHPRVKAIRHLGTILAVEVLTPEDSTWFNSIQQWLYQFYLSKGVYLRPLGNVVYIMPPYCITPSELAKVYAAVKDSLDKLQQQS